MYRFFAAIFALAGLLVFLVLYFRDIEGNILAALSHPSTIAKILVPFLPAAILSWKGSKIEGAFFDLLGDSDAKTPPKDGK